MHGSAVTSLIKRRWKNCESDNDGKTVVRAQVRVSVVNCSVMGQGQTAETFWGRHPVQVGRHTPCAPGQAHHAFAKCVHRCMRPGKTAHWSSLEHLN